MIIPIAILYATKGRNNHARSNNFSSGDSFYSRGIHSSHTIGDIEKPEIRRNMPITLANRDRVAKLLSDFADDSKVIPLDVRLEHALADFDRKRVRCEQAYDRLDQSKLDTMTMRRDYR